MTDIAPLVAELRELLAEDDDHMVASGEDLAWLIEQSLRWPIRVHPERTTNDRFLRFSMAATLLDALTNSAGIEGEADRSFQDRVQPWMMECFGPGISADRAERNHRFLEESLELVQSLGCTRSEAHQLVDYVFNRPIGEPFQEVGGVRVTLAALCLVVGLSEDDAANTELARISAPETVIKIRAKQAAKPKHSPLPAAPSGSGTDEEVELESIIRKAINRALNAAYNPAMDHKPEYRAMEKKAAIHEAVAALSARSGEVERLTEALEPFVNVRDQYPQSYKLIDPKLDGLSPVTVTVTKAQFLAACAALKEAGR